MRLGIEAPRDVRIHREEVYEKIMKENVMSSGISMEEFEKLKEVFNIK